MFTLLLIRSGPPHIVNFYSNNSYRTICGESFTKNNNINTLSADNTFTGICNKCKGFYDKMHQADLDFYPENARSSSIFTEDMLFLHRLNIIGPRARYMDFVDYKFSAKISKYRRLLHKKQLKIKSSVFKNG